MFNVAVISAGKGKTVINKACEGVADICVKNRKYALKKLIKKGGYENIIVNHRQRDMKIFEGRLKKYQVSSVMAMLPVAYKAVRLTAEKYGIKIPLNEVYITAPWDISGELIPRLGGLSRLYTVVSDNPDGKIMDELYYSCGCVIRCVKELENKLSDDSVIIRADKKLPPPFASAPLINFGKDDIEGKTVVNMSKISVSDEKMRQTEKLWGGISGVGLYELTGLVPDINAEININKSADEIFLLDREAF